MAILITEFRVLAGLLPTDASKDTEINEAIGIGISIMETYCNRGLAYVAEQVDKFVHFSGNVVPLYRYPVDELLEFKGVAPSAQDHVDNSAGLIFSDVNNSDYSFTVKYSGGYTYALFPAALTLVLKSIFRGIYDSVEGTVVPEKQVITSVKLGDMSLQYDTGANTATYSDGAFGPFNATQVFILNRFMRLRA